MTTDVEPDEGIKRLEEDFLMYCDDLDESVNLSSEEEQEKLPR